MAAADASKSSGAADSYIGSLISLTSKYEIRYEGVLYNINTQESSIGLRNVRSFGTEGRKKDGPQIPPSDKVYEYILFRGSDIKDLQVKSSPPAQTTPPIHNDPAIIQSHYSRAPAVSTSLPSVPSVESGTAPDLTSHTAQLGLPRATFQGGLPLYPPVGSLGHWGSSPGPLNTNGSGMTMPPMYWQGFYGPTSGLPPHVQQQPLIRPPAGLPIPPTMQQPMQYPSMNSTPMPSNVPNLPGFSSPLLPPASFPTVGGPNLSLMPSTLVSSFSPTQAVGLPSETSLSLMPNKVPFTSLPPPAARSANLPLMSLTSSLDINSSVPPISSKPQPVSGSSLPSQSMPQSLSTVAGLSTSRPTEVLVVPPLVTPGQLLHPGPTTLPSSQLLQTVDKDLDTMQAVLSEPSSSAPAETKAPILPLPIPSDQKVNGAAFPTRPTNRGRGRGRGNGITRAVAKFTEDFDFTAMNEKFKKDEVWGHLGKSKDHTEDGNDDYADDNLDEQDIESSEIEVKPVYIKDEFFDSLSCNTLDRGGTRNGRTKFSEQRKVDIETFGDFTRYRGSRGGHGPPRGGRGRGSYYGRGYVGYFGRGRGQAVSSRPN